ncbi:MAG: hypothetical protein EBT07_17980, partial [Actinobacteria bacterium]|nr:hypothetical protein [Actinomycetota bacterium]
MALTIVSNWDSSSVSSRLVVAESSGHWYDAEGRSAHVIIGKNGKERNTWRIEQAIMSALTLPREEGEDLSEYAKRVVEDSRAQTKKAAEHGTAVHTEMENILLGRSPSKDEVLQPYIETFKKWADANVEKTYWCEKGLVGGGYAGRCDAYVRLKGIGDAIIDLKNRKVNRKYNLPPFYPTDAQQLWAYRNACENPKA